MEGNDRGPCATAEFEFVYTLRLFKTTLSYLFKNLPPVDTRYTCSTNTADVRSLISVVHTRRVITFQARFFSLLFFLIYLTAFVRIIVLIYMYIVYACIVRKLCDKAPRSSRRGIPWDWFQFHVRSVEVHVNCILQGVTDAMGICKDDPLVVLKVQLLPNTEGGRVYFAISSL